jgi:oligo-1,6-glucosidase/alpha-glucosidase
LNVSKQKIQMNKTDVPGHEWWRGTTVYQIYPRSFFDSNNDGIGDLGGIISKLDYIKDSGFETIWLSPFFSSPQRDFGYDISDYYTIAPEYGRMLDVEELISEIHSRGMYVLFDMVLNHTSDQHPWFIESRSSKDNPKRNWYIWKDSRNGAAPRGKPKPPNNWRSQVSGSGWHFDENSSQWYWAAFLPFQPDLNYRNPDVKKAIFRMLEFWLNKGVDGFRLDIIGSIYEDEQFRNSPFTWKFFPDENNTGMLFKSTCRTQNLAESIAFSRELKTLTSGFNNPPRFLVGETFGSPAEVSRFCREDGLHAAFAFKCTSVPFTAEAFRKLIIEYEDCFAYPLHPAWAFSNHDRTRRISALGANTAKAKLNAAFQITVRGTAFFYFGEELGMTDTKLPHRQSLDPVSFPFRKLPSFLFNYLNSRVHGAINRDQIRTPMQWSKDINAGFCSPGTSPWLPLNPEYENVNADTAAANPDSIGQCIRRFLKLRSNSAALRFGSISLIPEKLLPENVLGFKRSAEGEDLIVFLNFSDKDVKIDGAAIQRKGEFLKLLASTNYESESAALSDIIKMSAFEGIIAYPQRIE